MQPTPLFRITFLVAALLWLPSVHATSAKLIKVKGKVISTHGQGIAFAAIAINSDGQGVVCDLNGTFEVFLKEGVHALQVQSIGYQNKTERIVVDGQRNQALRIVLLPSTETLEAVDVVVQSKSTQRQQLPYAITAIDTKPLANSTRDVNQVLKTTTGIHIREEGGLGSGFNLSLNGLSGKQVKFFIDGIPMENTGTALTLNNFPISVVERIEVFKGVVPIELGADALGGAINVITKQNQQSYIDASYSTGSFNTHRLALASKWYQPKSGVVFNASAFYNHSDNNYWVDVDIVDWETGKIQKEERVKRFHDNYWSYMVQAEVGLLDKAWADYLLVGFTLAKNHDNRQHGTRMQDVYGQVYSKSNTITPQLKFKNSRLLNGKLDLQLYATFVSSNALVADTSSRQYNWYGEYVISDDENIGEMGWSKTLFSYDDAIFNSSINARYQLDDEDKYQIAFNHTINYILREGKDPAKDGVIPFETPNTIKKQISGLALSSQFFNHRVKTTLFSKYYNYNASIVDVDNSGQANDLNPQYSKLGYGFAATWFINPSVQVKSSLEKTFRLPEAYEVFGDGANLLPSPELEPETSLNFNVGSRYFNRLNRHKWVVDGNVFYRNSNDFIRQEATGKNSQFVNVRDVLSTGVEGEISYTFNRFVNATVNATWQNMLNKSKYENGVVSNVYNDRIPNIPYLFGHTSLGLRHAKLFDASDEINFRWSMRFVEEYYLRWPSQGAQKYAIPSQWSQSCEINYSWGFGMHNIGLQCNNITNAQLYDNYKVQLPSRAFYVKYRFSFQLSEK